MCLHLETVIFGRERELESISAACAHRRVRVLVGPAGIGKTTSWRAAVGERHVHEIDGRWMGEREQAIAYLAEELADEPPQAGTAGIARWLDRSLHRLGRGAPVVVWDAFDRVESTLASVVLLTIARTELPFALVLESRRPLLVEPFASRIRILEFGPLSEEATSALCRQLGRSPADFPKTVLGHPGLMRLYVEAGTSGMREWAERLVRSLPSAQYVLLTRLCLARSPYQSSWARLGSSEADYATLVALGAVSRRGHVVEPALDYLLDHLRSSGELEELERSLLTRLAARSRLARPDLERALDLCGRVGDPALRLRLMSRHSMLAPARDAPTRLPSLAETPRIVGARRWLGAYEALATSQKKGDADLAAACVLYAQFHSGLRLVPDTAAVFVQRQLTEDPPRPARDELALLTRLLDAIGVQGLPAAGPLHDPRLESGVELLEQAVDASWANAPQAAAELERAASLFGVLGAENGIQIVRQVQAAHCFRNGRDANLARLLGVLCETRTGERHHWHDFWQVALEWQQGRHALLESAAVDLPEPAADGARILPGPYGSDYLAHCFGALLDRSRGEEPELARAAVFVEALRRLRPLDAIVLGAVTFAQHCLIHLHEEPARHIAEELRSGPGFAATHGAALLALASSETSPADLLEVLTNACSPAERLTAPYYVLLAARRVLDGRLSAPSFFRWFDGLPLDTLSGVPARLVGLIGAELARGESRPEAFPPGSPEATFLRQLAAPQPSPRVDDPQVADLLRYLDEHWFESVNLGEYCLARGFSPKSLSKRFARALGLSPKQYQLRARIKRAAWLLRETDWDITAIAQECGFYDGPDFTRAFRKSVGCSPSDYRKV